MCNISSLGKLNKAQFSHFHSNLNFVALQLEGVGTWLVQGSVKERGPMSGKDKIMLLV